MKLPSGRVTCAAAAMVLGFASAILYYAIIDYPLANAMASASFGLIGAALMF